MTKKKYVKKLFEEWLKENSMYEVDGTSWTLEDAETEIAREYQWETPLSDKEKILVMLEEA